MFNKIIVPVDIGHQEHAQRMYDAAKEVANDQSKIIFMSVMEILPDYAMTYVPGDTLGEIEKDVKAMLEAFKAKYGDIETRVESGHPADTIVAVAESEEADAIVIASHRPGFSDYFLGSTAAKVVRHSKCSVLVLR